MENEYNYLEQKLGENGLRNSEKIRILEKQKELLLQYLIDSNKNLFNSLTLKRGTVLPGIITFFNDETCDV